MEINKEFWINTLQSYLRIDTSQPNVDYSETVNFLSNLSNELNIPMRIYYPLNNSTPLIIFMDQRRPYQTNPNGGILFNSHMDVVSVVDASAWIYPPFEAVIDAHGKLYARGSQDMKTQGIQYLAALHMLRQSKIELEYDIFVTFSPNEEIGGYGGMREFVESETFANLNIVFAIDESCASPGNFFFIFNGERSTCQPRFNISGATGHSSMFVPHTVGVKLERLLGYFNSYRNSELYKINAQNLIGHTTTINLTTVTGGVMVNVLPDIATVTFDMRVGVNNDHEQLLYMLQQWAIDCNGGDTKQAVTLDFIQRFPKIPPTNVNGILCRRFLKILKDDLDYTYKVTIAPGSTDAKFLQLKGIPVLGFTPLRNIQIRLHDTNEYVTLDAFFEGCTIFFNVMQKMSPSQNATTQQI